MKKRFPFFKRRQPSQTVEEVEPEAQSTPTQATVRETQVSSATRKSPEELLADLDARYYNEDFDPVLNLLQGLPAGELPEMFIENQLNELDAVKTVIDKRLLDAVMKNYAAFVEGMQHVQDVKQDLSMSTVHCTSSRRALARADKGLVHNAMTVLAKQRKKARLAQLYAMVTAMKQLTALEAKVNGLLEAGSYAAAVIAYNDRMTQIGMEDFTCLAGLQIRLSAMSTTMKALFDARLRSVCGNWDLPAFLKIIQALLLLGEAESLRTSMVTFFLASIDTQCQRTVLNHISSNEATTERMGFSALCSFVDFDRFKSCVLTMSTGLWDVLWSTHQAIQALGCLTSTFMGERDKIKEQIVKDQRAYEDEEQRMKILEDERKQQLEEMLAQSEDDIKARKLLAEQDEDESDRELTERRDRAQKFKALMQGSDDAARLLDRVLKHKDFRELERMAKEFSAKGLIQVWARCQTRMGSLLAAAKLTTGTTNLEHFLTILNAGYKLITIGEHLSGEPAEGLRDSLEQKSAEYVRNFHKETLESLRTTLENDLWRCLPLKDTFSFRDVKEMRPFLDAPVPTAPSPKPRTRHLNGDSTISDELSSMQADVLVNFFAGTNLFRPAAPRPVAVEKDATQLAAERAKERERQFELKFSLPKDVPSADALQKSEADDRARETPPPTVTSATLNVARFIGRYLHIMRELPPLSVDVYKALREVFDFYLYTVFTLFGISASRFFGSKMNKRLYPALREAVNNVKDRVVKGEFGGGVFDEYKAPEPEAEVVAELEPATPANKMLQVSQAFNRVVQAKRRGSVMVKAEATPEPHPEMVKLQETIDLNNRQNLYGTVERTVAAESVVFLSQLFDAMCAESLLPEQEQYRVDELRVYAKQVSADFKSYIYRNLAPFVLPFDTVNSHLNTCKWDIKELQTDTNSYVDALLTALKTSKNTVFARGGLPPHVMAVLWGETAQYVAEQLVIGYSAVKKCTFEGRALMTQDLTMLRQGLERLTDLAPLPGWHVVDDYVKAYYLPEADFMTWMQEHTCYSASQFIALASLGPGAKLRGAAKKDFLRRVKEAVEAIVATKTATHTK